MHHHLPGKEMLMGSWPWRGVVVCYSAAPVKIRLYLPLLWKVIMGDKGI